MSRNFQEKKREGDEGERIFWTFAKDIMPRIGYTEGIEYYNEATGQFKNMVILEKKKVKRGEKPTEFQKYTDMDALIYDAPDGLLERTNLRNFSFHEVKHEQKCFADRKTGNLFIEDIENKDIYCRLPPNEPNKGKLLDIDCLKPAGNGWYRKTGLTADWYQFVLPMEIGTDERISDTVLEAWKQSSNVPEDALIITNARPEIIIVSITRNRLEEFIEGRYGIDEEENKTLKPIEAEKKWVSDGDKWVEKMAYLLPIEIVMGRMRYIPRLCAGCTDIGSTRGNYPRVIGDEAIKKERETEERSIGYIMPVAMATGIFKAQKKNGEETEIALFGNKNKNVYVAPEIRAAIEDFYGMKEEYPCTCEVCKSMIRGTQWV